LASFLAAAASKILLTGWHKKVLTWLDGGVKV
jgi:hypothetical protein